MSFAESIEKILIEDVVTVKAEATVRDAAALMIEKRITCLPVSIGLGAIGMITEKDILGKVVTVGLDSKKIRVKEIMSTPLVIVPRDTSIGEAARKMLESNVRRLVVSDSTGRLVGLVTMTDIIRWIAKQDESASFVSDFLGPKSQ
jgi:CBS domain-containing protein